MYKSNFNSQHLRKSQIVLYYNLLLTRALTLLRPTNLGLASSANTLGQVNKKYKLRSFPYVCVETNKSQKCMKDYPAELSME